MEGIEVHKTTIDMILSTILFMFYGFVHDSTFSKLVAFQRYQTVFPPKYLIDETLPASPNNFLF